MRNNKLSLILLGIVAVLVLSACQPAAAAPGVAPRVISVNGQGQVFLTPDLATIFIGVQSQNATVGDALKENNAKAQAIVESLTAMGVEAKDIQTSGFNVIPQQQFGPQGEVTGVIYLVDNTVNVTVRDLTRLGEMLDAVVKAGANSINGIQFDVKDRQKALSQARQLAIDNARAQAEEVATAAGVTLGPVQSINIYTSGGPVPMFDAKGGMAVSAGQVPVSAGQLAITVDVNMSYEIK